MCKLAFKELAVELSMELMLEAKQKGFDYQDLANFVDCSPISVQKYYYGEKTPSLPVFIALWKRVKPSEVLKRLAEYSGYAAVKLPEVKLSNQPLVKLSASVMKETADVLNTVADSLKDSKITDEEKTAIKKEIDEAIESLLRLKALLE